jgi:excisionase family DNA binding protein
MTTRHLTTTEVAELLGVSRSTVHAWLDAGALAHVRYNVGLRPTIRIRREDLDRFLDEWSDDGSGTTGRRRDG